MYMNLLLYYIIEKFSNNDITSMIHYSTLHDGDNNELTSSSSRLLFREKE
jgi:hypothetical protein